MQQNKGENLKIISKDADTMLDEVVYSCNLSYGGGRDEGLWFKASPGSQWRALKKTVNNCNPSYTGGGGRRIPIQDLSQRKA
jgi:hypothetical protein